MLGRAITPGPRARVLRGGSHRPSGSAVDVGEESDGRRRVNDAAGQERKHVRQHVGPGRCGLPAHRKMMTGGCHHHYSVDVPVTDRADAPPARIVRLLWAPLDISPSHLRGLAGCLSSEELQRAARFHRPLDRARFLAARGWLRHLLAIELRCAPSDIRIVADHGRKPRLACADLCFSSARSAGIALYATSWRMEVGVDIEAIRATADINGIVARFMSPAEQRALLALPPTPRLAALFQCWTRKEAYAKGIGTGVRLPLRDIDVWERGARAATLSGWSIHQVDIAPGFAAAVAGASLDDWVPQDPRRLDTSGLDHPYRPPPGCSPLPWWRKGG